MKEHEEKAPSCSFVDSFLWALLGLGEAAVMPDPIEILWAMAAAAGLAAGLMLVLSWPWETPPPTRMRIGWVLGVGAGFYLGAVVLGSGPRLGLAENRDRFLLLVLPSAILVELIAAFSSVPRWMAWLARAIVAGGAGLVLLHGSVYVEELSGPGSRLWTPEETRQWLAALAAALLALWVLLGLLMHVAPSRSVPLALAVTCAGAAVVIMFSGSLINGQLGFPLAGGLLGATIASCLLPAPPRGTSAIGVGVVGLFVLLAGGRFFSELPSLPAVILFAAPLLCWLTEGPFVRKLRPKLRGSLALFVVLIAVAIALFLAQKKLTEESQEPSSPGEPTSEDYLNFGK
jgi:hypothetical protein